MDKLIQLLYVDQNLTAKLTADICKIPIGVVKSNIRRMRLTKTRDQIQESIRNSRLLRDVPQSWPTVAEYKGIQLKSVIDLGYALYLDSAGYEWHYREMIIPYVDMMTGSRHIYTIDFTVVSQEVHWVETTEQSKMIPDDKRIYAHRRAEEAGIIYRGLSEGEYLGIIDALGDFDRTNLIVGDLNHTGD